MSISTLESSLRSAHPRSRFAPCACSASTRNCRPRSRRACDLGIGLAPAGGLRRLALLLSCRGFRSQLHGRALDRLLAQLPVDGAVGDDRRAAVELDEHAGGARLVDVLLAEADRRSAVRVAVDPLGQPGRLLEQLLGPLPQLQRGNLVGVEAGEVSGEHTSAVVGAQRGVNHPSRLA